MPPCLHYPSILVNDLIITRCFGKLQKMDLHDTLPPSLQIQRPGLVTRGKSLRNSAMRPQALFFRLRSALWRLCVGRLRTCRFP